MRKTITAVLEILTIATSVVLIACMAWALFSTSGAAASTVARDMSELEDITFKISVDNSATHPNAIGAYAMETYIEKASGGKIQVEVYPNGQLGSEDEILQQVQSGAVEMATASCNQYSTIQPKFAVLDIPFLFDSYEQAWMVLDSIVGQDILATLENNGLKGLGWFENGFRNVTTTNRAVSTLEDFKGFKIRTMAASNHMLNFQSLGANPTPVPYSELYMALSQSIVEGQENPLANIWDINLYEVQSYVCMTRHIYDPMPLSCNLNWWNSLPAEYQEIIQHGAVLAQNYSRFCNCNRESILREELIAKGMTFIDIDEADRQKMIDTSQPACLESIKKDVGEEYVDAFLNQMAEVLSDVNKGVTIF